MNENIERVKASKYSGDECDLKSYKTRVNMNLNMCEHRVIIEVASKYRISRVKALQLLLDTSTIFNDTLDDLLAESSYFEHDFRVRERDMKGIRKKQENCEKK